jgi:hypothetical protein
LEDAGEKFGPEGEKSEGSEWNSAKFAESIDEVAVSA